MHKPRGPRVLVEITDEIIKASVTADSSHCMIAEALRKAVPSAKAIAVDLQTIRFSNAEKGLRYVYLTPRIAQVPLLQFDQGIMPEPFRFQLRGAHVVGMAYRKAKPQSEQAKIASTKSLGRARTAAQGLAKAKLVNRKSSRPGGQIERVGGQTPPTTAFANRRSFGLRALGRPPAKANA